MLLGRFAPHDLRPGPGRVAGQTGVGPGERRHAATPTTPLFVGLIIGVILIIGGLTFFPALALGPLAEGLALDVCDH